MSASFPPCQAGQGVILKKSHPCGGRHWIIYKLGMDVGLQCEQYGQRIKPARRSSSALWTAGRPINISVEA
jgi:hypothetical protein